MAICIRMSRFGKPGRPYYRIGAFDERVRREGVCLEVLGTYHPMEKKPEAQLTLKRDRIEHWLGLGACPSETIAEFLRKNGFKLKSRANYKIKRNKKRSELRKAKAKRSAGKAKAAVPSK